MDLFGSYRYVLLLCLLVGTQHHASAIPPPKQPDHLPARLPGIWKTPYSKVPNLPVPGTKTSPGSLLPKDGDNVRLSGYVIPDVYNITLIPDMTEFSIIGYESIVVNVTEETNNITLHILSITVNEESVQVIDLATGEELSVVDQQYSAPLEFYSIVLQDNLVAGQQYEVRINFTGSLLQADHMGFYRDTYVIDGETRSLGVTQFESTGARRAFPCFDEPGYKARFNIALGRPEDYSAVSNMPRVGESTPISEIPGYLLDRFEETPPMSSYLIAFLVSDFATATDGDSFTVYARSDRIGETGYAVDIGPRILQYYGEYLGIPFALPKMDSVAVPSKGGAMENWGLITYGQSYLVQNDEENTIDDKLGAASVIAHEQAHQWFGDLVTTHWWSDIWLNEGFANFFEHIGVNGVEPDFKYDQEILIEQVQRVLPLDSTENTRPISMNVSYPDEIENMFDTITYSKGASIIRMLQHILTPESFQKGLNRYLSARAYQPATRQDLYTALDAQAHADGTLSDDLTVDAIFETWTLQKGFPLITVTRDYDTGTATVQQKRFVASNPDGDYEELWFVPLSYTTETELDFENTAPKEFLRVKPEITINGLPVGDAAIPFVIFNVQETGYYRVNYDVTNWQLLAGYLVSDDGLNIHPLNRAQLLDDSFALSQAGLLNISYSLTLTRYLNKEVELVPWQVAINILGFLDTQLRNTPAYDDFATYTLSLLEGVYEYIGFEQNPDEPKSFTLTRYMLLPVLNELGNADSSAKSLEAFQEWMASTDPDTNNPISPNYRFTIIATAVREGDIDVWNFVYQRYLNSGNTDYAEALGYSRNETLLSSILEQTLVNASDGGIPDFLPFFYGIVINDEFPDLAYNFISENFDRIVEAFNGYTEVVNGIYYILLNTNTREGLDSLIQLINDHDVADILDPYVADAESRLAWNDEYSEFVSQWLSDAVAVPKST